MHNERFFFFVFTDDSQMNVVALLAEGLLIKVSIFKTTCSVYQDLFHISIER
jgi:hypothetical protein